MSGRGSAATMPRTPRAAPRVSENSQCHASGFAEGRRRRSRSQHPLRQTETEATNSLASSSSTNLLRSSATLNATFVKRSRSTAARRSAARSRRSSILLQAAQRIAAHLRPRAQHYATAAAGCVTSTRQPAAGGSQRTPPTAAVRCSRLLGSRIRGPRRAMAAAVGPDVANPSLHEESPPASRATKPGEPDYGGPPPGHPQYGGGAQPSFPEIGGSGCEGCKHHDREIEQKSGPKRALPPAKFAPRIRSLHPRYPWFDLPN